MNNDDFETIETEDVKDNDEMQKNDEPVNKTSIRKIICEICLYIVLFVVCIYVVPNYVLQRTVVSGSSMLDTLHDGESMLVEKVSYRFKDPSRFDIIKIIGNATPTPAMAKSPPCILPINILSTMLYKTFTI